MITYIADVLFLGLIIASIWSLTAIMMRVLVSWEFFIKLILPMCCLLALGLRYFGVIRWLKTLSCP